MKTSRKPTSVPAGDEADKDQVSALARGLQLLDAFRTAERFLSVQDLVEHSGLPKATVSRLAHTLAANGYLEYAEHNGQFYLGARVISLGFSALGALRVRQVARPFMRELAESCSASVGIGSRDRHTMLYIENAASAPNQNFRLNIGSRVPLATSAMGRAYYCGLDEREREQVLSELSQRRGGLQADQGVAGRGTEVLCRAWLLPLDRRMAKRRQRGRRTLPPGRRHGGARLQLLRPSFQLPSATCARSGGRAWSTWSATSKRPPRSPER